MKVRAYVQPRPHLVIDDVLSGTELRFVRKLANLLVPQMIPGTMVTHGSEAPSEQKRNRVIWVHQKDAPGRIILNLLESRSKSACQSFLAVHDEPLFELLAASRFTELQVSAYGGGDYYRQHTDAAMEDGQLNITVLFFVQAGPRKRFTGGDFRLSFRGKSRTVRWQENRMVIFPGSTPHEVTTVRELGRAGGSAPLRFSLQVWPWPPLAKSQAKG